MKEEAVFSDGTREYRIPWEPKVNDQMKVRLRVARGEQAQISLIHEEERLPMTLEFSREEFDYYAVTVQLKDEWYSYYFELCQDGKIYFYDRVGMTTQMRQESCTRFWWTGSAMATARTTWKIGNTAIFKP